MNEHFYIKSCSSDLFSNESMAHKSNQSVLKSCLRVFYDIIGFLKGTLGLFGQEVQGLEHSFEHNVNDFFELRVNYLHEVLDASLLHFLVLSDLDAHETNESDS